MLRFKRQKARRGCGQRSLTRAQPNSAALKNASVFGAPELRQRAGVI